MAATPARRPQPGSGRPVAGANRNKRPGAVGGTTGTTGPTADAPGTAATPAGATAVTGPVPAGNHDKADRTRATDGSGGADEAAGGRPVQRAALLLAALGLLTAAYAWLTPITVPANRGLPFGCGAPFRPNDIGLAGQVCGAALDGRRSVAVAALAVALVGLLVAVLLQLTGSGAVARSVTRLGLGLLVASPLAAGAVVVLLAPLEVRSADGATVVSCGRAVTPTVDPFAAGLCADVPGEHRGTGLLLAGAAALLGVGVPVVASARRAPAVNPA